MKHQIVHALQKYLLNPPIKLLFGMGVAPPGYALLETIGRKTGKARRTPVGDARVGDRLWIVAEHGMQAGFGPQSDASSARACEAAQRVRCKVAHGHGACAFGR
jgi:F420H(2)-dependent quinone reductase